jgi:hypothetical protein
LWLAVTCLACASLAWYGTDLGPSEFSGGSITGPILDLFEAGTLLFPCALVLAFFYPRIAAAITLAACLSCLPLYLYFAAPGPFRWIFRGEYSVPAPSSFVWNGRTMAGILSIFAAAYVCIRTFSVFRFLLADLPP